MVRSRFKGLRRRLGVSVPKVVVRPHMPFAFVLGGWLLFGALTASIAWVWARRDEVSEGKALAVVNAQLQLQAAELSELRSRIEGGASEARIDRVANQQLQARIRALEGENAALKEDLMLFERLVPDGGEVASVRVVNFRVYQEAEGAFRYRLFAAFHADRQNPEFKGSLRLLIKYRLQDGVREMLLPNGQDGVSSYRLDIRHFLRQEGSFGLPRGAALLSVEAQIFQGDTLRARQTAEL